MLMSALTRELLLLKYDLSVDFLFHLPLETSVADVWLRWYWGRCAICCLFRYTEVFQTFNGAE